MTKLKLKFHSIKSDFFDKEQVSFGQPTGVFVPQTTMVQTFALSPVSDENQKIINELLRKHSKAWQRLAYK